MGNQSLQIAARIKVIAEQIASGKTDGLVEKFGKKWNLKKTSINNYIRLAKPEAKRLSELKDKVVNDTITAEIKEAAKNGLKSLLEVDAKLQEIIFNEFILVQDENGRIIKVENTTADKLKAMDLYFKRNGHYAPEKQEGEMKLIWEENKNYKNK